MSTSIDDILKQFISESTEDTVEHITETNHNTIFDFSLPLDIRMNALNKVYTENPEQIIEVTKKINAIYCMSPVGIVRKFLFEIASYSILPIEIRMDCSITLADIEMSQDLGLECMDKLYPHFHRFPVICQLEYLIRLANSERYSEIYKSRLTKFLIDSDISESWRYKMILSLINQINSTVSETSFEFTIQVCRLFVLNTRNSTAYRILACQYLLSQKQHIEYAENTLMTFMRDSTLAHNLRADAADVLLHYGTLDTIQSAENVLSELGGKFSTFYENKENVHTKEIEDSVRETVQFLDTLNLKPIPSFDTVSYNLKQLAKKMYRPKEIKYNTKNVQLLKKELCELNIPIREHIELIKEELSVEEDKVSNALLRIELDRTIFKGINHTLKSVLLLLYTYIQSQDAKYELERRLVEELIDMSGTCTSGYISRLMNVLSGFGDYSLRISWQDQISANLKGRLNAKMQKDENMEKIIEEMINRDLADRSEFLKFFRKNISSIREEMYQEFRHFMEDLEWDEYFQKAVLQYDA
jgi:hypothetical protein